MAGSPSAGKTESSRNLIKSITKDEQCVVRIDLDDLRNRFDEYTGANSHLFRRYICGDLTREGDGDILVN